MLVFLCFTSKAKLAAGRVSSAIPSVCLSVCPRKKLENQLMQKKNRKSTASPLCVTDAQTDSITRTHIAGVQTHNEERSNVIFQYFGPIASPTGCRSKPLKCLTRGRPIQRRTGTVNTGPLRGTQGHLTGCPSLPV